MEKVEKDIDMKMEENGAGTDLQETEPILETDLDGVNGHSDTLTESDPLEAVEPALNGSTEGEETGATEMESEEAAPAAIAEPRGPVNISKFQIPMIALAICMAGLVIALQTIKPVEANKGVDTLVKVPRNFAGWFNSEDYPMSEEAKKVLMPDEYLARVYRSSDGAVADFTIIAGSHTAAFHNPQVCFRVQRWNFTDNKLDSLEVPGLEHPIPVRIVRLVNSDDERRQSVGMYFYATPLGYRTDTSSARIMLFAARAAGIKKRAYFVRFIKDGTGNAERDALQLKEFASAALAEMVKTNPEVIH